MLSNILEQHILNTLEDLKMAGVARKASSAKSA
jgi:hypothetical protein